jgi:hypothetical protein
MNFAALERKIHIVERDDARENLPDMLHPQKRFIISHFIFLPRIFADEREFKKS